MMANTTTTTTTPPAKPDPPATIPGHPALPKLDLRAGGGPLVGSRSRGDAPLPRATSFTAASANTATTSNNNTSRRGTTRTNLNRVASMALLGSAASPRPPSSARSGADPPLASTARAALLTVPRNRNASAAGGSLSASFNGTTTTTAAAELRLRDIAAPERPSGVSSRRKPEPSRKAVALTSKRQRSDIKIPASPRRVLDATKRQRQRRQNGGDGYNHSRPMPPSSSGASSTDASSTATALRDEDEEDDEEREQEEDGGAADDDAAAVATNLSTTKASSSSRDGEVNEEARPPDEEEADAAEADDAAAWVNGVPVFAITKNGVLEGEKRDDGSGGTLDEDDTLEEARDGESASLAFPAGSSSDSVVARFTTILRAQEGGVHGESSDDQAAEELAPDVDEDGAAEAADTTDEKPPETRPVDDSPTRPEDEVVVLLRAAAADTGFDGEKHDGEEEEGMPRDGPAVAAPLPRRSCESSSNQGAFDSHGDDSNPTTLTTATGNGLKEGFRRDDLAPERATPAEEEAGGDAEEEPTSSVDGSLDTAFNDPTFSCGADSTHRDHVGEPTPAEDAFDVAGEEAVFLPPGDDDDGDDDGPAASAPALQQQQPSGDQTCNTSTPPPPTDAADDAPPTPMASQSRLPPPTFGGLTSTPRSSLRRLASSIGGTTPRRRATPASADDNHQHHTSEGPDDDTASMATVGPGGPPPPVVRKKSSVLDYGNGGAPRVVLSAAATTTPRSTTTDMARSTIHAGWLWKYSVGKTWWKPLGNWRRRYFTLDDRGLWYFGGQTEGTGDESNKEAERGARAASRREVLLKGHVPVAAFGTTLTVDPTQSHHRKATPACTQPHRERDAADSPLLPPQSNAYLMLTFAAPKPGRWYRLLMRADTAEEKAAWIDVLTAHVFRVGEEDENDR